MLTTTRPRATDVLRADTGWAVLSAVLGLLAGGALIAYFVLDQPFTAGPLGYGWVGTVNDVSIAAQFLTSIPVATAVQRRLPVRPAVRAVTVAGVIAMAVVALLQVLLVSGVLTFEVQILLVTPAVLVVFGWILGTSAIAHRHRLLPRRLTRFGLLLGSAYPVALLLTVAGYAIGSALGIGLVLVGPGLVLGGLAWLALPLWPLLLARLALTKGKS